MAEHESGGMGELRLPEEPPRWPKVVGTISLVWAGLGLMCNGCGMLQTMGVFGGPGEVPEGFEMPPNLEPGTVQIFMMGVGWFWYWLLIPAGISTLMHKRAGRPLHLVWSVGSLLIWAIGMVVSWQQTARMLEWARDNPQHPFTPFIKFGMVIGYIIAFVTLIWPVFCGVWFGLMRKDPGSSVEERAA